MCVCAYQRQGVGGRGEAMSGSFPTILSNASSATALQNAFASAYQKPWYCFEYILSIFEFSIILHKMIIKSHRNYQRHGKSEMCLGSTPRCEMECRNWQHRIPGRIMVGAIPKFKILQCSKLAGRNNCK